MRVHSAAATAADYSKRKPSKAEIKKAARLGVRIEPGSKNKITAAELRGVVSDVKKLPPAVRKTLRQGGSGIDLVAGKGITSHPLHKSLKGVKTPTEGDGERTYDTVIGGGGGILRPAVLAVKQLNPFGNDLATAGTESVALHESGHTFDVLGGSLSSKKAWANIHKKSQWDTPYFGQNKNEAFAESFSDYLYSKETRQSLPTKVKNYFTNLFDRLRGKKKSA